MSLRWHTLPAIAALLSGFGCPLLAGDTLPDRETLKGIKGVSVLIEQINPDAVSDGLSVDQIQTDVELRLRKAGINVLGPGSGDSVLLHVYANVMKVSGEPRIVQELYIFNCEVALFQKVFVAENNTSTLQATWSSEVLGNVGRQNMSKGIREALGDLVDKFLNAYLSVNQKQ